MAKRGGMKRLTVIIEGRDDGDIENALNEVREGVERGCVEGYDYNDTGAYRFSVDKFRSKRGRELNW